MPHGAAETVPRTNDRIGRRAGSTMTVLLLLVIRFFRGHPIDHQNEQQLAVPDLRAFSVQYHPEAGPGPHDARYLFGMFEDLMLGGAN